MVLCFFLLINWSSYAQTKEDLKFIIETNPVNGKEKKKGNKFFANESSEIKLGILGAIRFYQLFISTQDVPVCNFTLSCSRFGVSAIKKYGFFYGILMTSDRLQRCNGLGRRYYHADLKTGLAVDYPIDYYYLWHNLDEQKALASDIHNNKDKD
jgi:putative component of membrane protein insertase Oxa1/YidC/SpoIIIJ protein YidD